MWNNALLEQNKWKITFLWFLQIKMSKRLRTAALLETFLRFGTQKVKKKDMMFKSF